MWALKNRPGFTRAGFLVVYETVFFGGAGPKVFPTSWPALFIVFSDSLEVRIYVLYEFLWQSCFGSDFLRPPMQQCFFS